MITKVTISILDDKKKRAVMRFYLDSLDWYAITDYATDPREFVVEFVRRLDPVISGKIESVTLSMSVDIPDGYKKQLPAVTSDVEEGAVMSTRTESGGVYHWNIPTAKEENFFPDGTLDTTNAAIADFYEWINLHAEVLPEITVNPVNSRGERIDGAYISGKQKFKAR